MLYAPFAHGCVDFGLKGGFGWAARLWEEAANRTSG